jgi:hypothetical protein
VERDTSNTQSVMLLLVRGTRTARPFSLPCNARKQQRKRLPRAVASAGRAMGVAHGPWA